MAVTPNGAWVVSGGGDDPYQDFAVRLWGLTRRTREGSSNRHDGLAAAGQEPGGRSSNEVARPCRSRARYPRSAGMASSGTELVPTTMSPLARRRGAIEAT